MNVTALPEDGASYRVYKTYNNGEGDLSDVTPLVLGNNVISVNAVNFDSASGRTVRLLLSEDVATNEFVVNGDYIIGENDGSSFTAPEGSSLISEHFELASESDLYSYVYTLTNSSDGTSSQAQQVLSLNITELPDGGASYSVYKTTANGSEYTSDPVSLELGSKQIIINSVAFDRTVKVRFTADVAVDELIANNTYLVGSASEEPSNGSTYPNGIFSAGSGANWPWIYIAAQIADGEDSQNTQTFVLNVTELPEEGASYRIYKTTLNGSDYFSPSVTLTIGVNKFTVPSTDFNRAVKLQLSSGAIAFEYFGLNGTDIFGTPIDSDGDGVDDYSDYAPTNADVQLETTEEAPIINISYNAPFVVISWENSSGFTLKSSTDLNSFSEVVEDIQTIDNLNTYIETIDNSNSRFFKLTND